MNNVDVAEAMIECVKQAMKDKPPGQPIIWDSLLEALEQYIKSEQHQILKARERKDKPFG